MSSLTAVDTRWAFTILVGAVAVERLLELRLAKRNAARALARGAVERGAGHYPWMVTLHTLFLLACPAEVWLFERPFVPALAAPAVLALAAAATLRLWVIASLGGRWTTRVLYVAGDPPVTAGPYRFLQHPNYLAVAVEILALPLVHTAWLTAALFSGANTLLLRERIRIEDQALADLASHQSMPQ